jgi:hypothetical protein
VFTLVVTSAVIPIPREWNSLDRVRIAVSVDGLPPEHDVRRAPATYERILRNIENRVVDISWAVINPMLTRPGYLDEYLEFWTRRPEIGRVWLVCIRRKKGEQAMTSRRRSHVSVCWRSYRASRPHIRR